MDAAQGLLAQLPPLPWSAQWALAGIGAAWLASKLLSYLRLVLSAFVLGGVNVGPYASRFASLADPVAQLRKYGKVGSWAIVTGASDGLGKEFASQLAAKGFNLILVSRTQAKLEALARELEQKHAARGLQVKTLAMDLARDDDGDYQRLGDLVRGLDVAMLVNNVGQSHRIPVTFLDTPADELRSIVTVNCIATLKVTQAVAPVLRARRRGLILTMGSFSGWTPTPYLATYSGSKAFLQQWSNALASELAADGVNVQLVLSHLVTTAMSKVRHPSLLVPTARGFVASALAKVGLGGFQAAPNTYTPWWSHAFMLWLIENVVGVNSRVTISQNRKMHVDIRARALRKRERDAKKK